MELRPKRPIYQVMGPVANTDLHNFTLSINVHFTITLLHVQGFPWMDALKLHKQETAAEMKSS